MLVEYMPMLPVTLCRTERLTYHQDIEPLSIDHEM